MKTENAIKKLEKYSKVNCNENGIYWTNICKHTIQFHTQEGKILCISVCPEDIKGDISIDYFPETYCDNLAQALRIARRHENGQQKQL